MKRKNEKLDSFWDKHRFFEKLLVLSWIVMLFTLLFLTSISVKASTSDDQFLVPYNVYNFNSNNQWALEHNDDSIHFLNLYWFASSINWDDTYLAYIDEVYSSGGFQVCYVFNPTINVNGNVTQGTSFVTTPILVDYTYKCTVSIGMNSVSDYWYSSANYIGNSGTISLGGNFNLEISNSGMEYRRYYPFYLGNTDGLYNGNDVIIGYIQNTPPINYGHATPPSEFHNPYFNPNSHAQPPVEVPPYVTINNYTWNTYNPPAIDDTDIISTLKSLIYVVNYLSGWLKDNISGEFQNLLSNLSAFFDYIGQTIQYYGGLIIDNIQNLITTFYNNMVSLVEDIAEKVAYISQPFDSNALIDAFESMQIYDDYDRIGQLIDDAFGFFDDISEPQSFTIPIDLRGITLLHQTQILYLDFGWINSAKGVIRAFMWTITTFGLLYTVIDSIPDYIQGQDE